MPDKIILAVFLGFFSCAAASAQETKVYDIRLAGLPVYSDPGFQEFIETAYGYLGRNKARGGSAFRDSLCGASSLKTNGVQVPAAKALCPVPPARPEASAAKYVLVNILPKTADYSGLLQDISASAGFVFYGERTIYSKTGPTTFIVGWARAEGLNSIFNNPGAAKVYINSRKKPVKA